MLALSIDQFLSPFIEKKLWIDGIICTFSFYTGAWFIVAGIPAKAFIIQ
jgi:hypothetical protein